MTTASQSTTKHNTRTHMSTREQYAQQGINYDKATRRLLAAHTDQHTRPTLRMAKAALNVLLPLTIALLLGACSGVAPMGINGLLEGTCGYSTDNSFQQPATDCVENFAGGWNCPTSCEDPRAGRTYGIDAADAGLTSAGESASLPSARMPSGIDPNLFASLARAYTGGINAPSGAAQIGHLPRVDQSGTNLEYASPAEVVASGMVAYDVLDTRSLIPTRAARVTTESRRVLITANGAREIGRLTLPIGVAIVELTIIAQSGSVPYIRQATLIATRNDFGIGIIDAGAAANRALAFSTVAISSSGADLVATVTANHDADGDLLWTCLLRATVVS